MLNAANDQADSEIYERYVKIGVYSINEVRDKLREERLDPSKVPGADEHFLFTSAGPILISQLQEYMNASLMPTQPKPPGLIGSDGNSVKDSATNRNGQLAKLIEEIIEIQKELRDEREKKNSGE